MRERGDDHLRLVAPAFGEQRTDRAVDQARDQSLALGRSSFALEVAARDTARGVEFLLVVDREGHEIDALARFFRGDHSRQDFAFSVGRNDRAVSLARDLSGFEC
jgi:hypothetical protein